jgi:hypothetical protein
MRYLRIACVRLFQKMVILNLICKAKFMTYEFKSAITRGGGILTPEHIIISDHSVEWRKRNKVLIGVDSVIIPLDKIASVELNDKVWGVDITIRGFGSNSIFAKNFTKNDARKIKELLTMRP